MAKNHKNRTWKMIGVEIVPGVVVHVSENVKPETIEALKNLAATVANMPDEELKEVGLYADYLKSRRKPKIGRPRKLSKNGVKSKTGS